MALQIPFANTGDRKPISQGSSADGSVSWEKGFTSLYALAPQDGGKFIDRQEFNQIVYEISEATIKNSQATAELINDEAISTAKTWSSNKVSTELGKKGGFNKQVKLTSSGNFTAPVTGWYKITCIGGGGGGGHAIYSTTSSAYDSRGGGGGGAGGTSIGFQKLTSGVPYSYIIGAGGIGAIATTDTTATDGGSTTFNGSSAITAGGGKAGSSGGASGVGGDGNYLKGAPGAVGSLDRTPINTTAVPISFGGNGGGNGGGYGSAGTGVNGEQNTGSGGSGGAGNGPTLFNGGNGGSGVIFIEYFDESEE